MNENKQIFGLRGNCWNTQEQKQAAETECMKIKEWNKVNKEYLRHLV